MAGIAGILLAAPRDERDEDAIFSRARELLDPDGTAWGQVAGAGTLGHAAPARSGSANRVTFSRRRGVAIAVDGEIFEAGGKRLDADGDPHPYLLDEYLARGPDLAASLNGAFNLAILDHRGENTSLVLASDRAGSLPLFYTEGPAGLLFSSSLGRLVRSGLFLPEPDFDAAADLLAFSFILGDATPFRGVRSLPPASILVASSDGISLRAYASFHRVEPRAFRGMSHCMSPVLERFTQVVESRATSSRRVGLGLTGGFDSRAVAAAAAKGGHRLATLTHTVPDATDVVLAREVAELCGFEHLWIQVDHRQLPELVDRFIEITGGLVGTVEPHVLTCLPRFSQAADIFLTGIGGEFARGFYSSRDTRLPEGNSRLVRFLFSKMNCVFRNEEEVRRLVLAPELQDLLGRAEEKVAARLDALPEGLSSFGKLDLFYLFERVRKLLIIKGSAPVRTAVEIRHPFLDGPLLELIWSLPEDLRRRSALHHHIIENCHDPLAGVPLAKTGSPLRRGRMDRLGGTIFRKGRTAFRLVTGRKRAAYRPRPSYHYATWTRSDFGRFLGAVLLDDRACDRGIFDPAEVRSLLESHFSGECDNTARILALAAFELGLRLADAGREAFEAVESAPLL